MQTITVLRRDTERKPFITSAGFTYEVRADTPKGGIPGLAISIQTHENHIVIGKAFVDPAGLEAVVNQFGIDAPAAKIIKSMGGTTADLGQQQYLWFLF